MPLALRLSVSSFTSIVLTFASSLAMANVCGTPFSKISQEYLQKCGGKAYSKCDGTDGLTQKTLFETGEVQAFSMQKKVFLEIGADWCPSCMVLVKQFQANPQLVARVEKSYVHVKLNWSTNSTRQLLKELGWNVIGVPTAAIYDPTTRKITEFVDIAYLGGAEKIVAHLEALAQGKSPVSSESTEEKIGDVRKSLLMSEIQSPAQFGYSKFSPSTLLMGEKRDRFLAHMQLGFKSLHGFHWINAARSFNSALRLENNPVARALLGLAYSEIENGQDKASIKEVKIAHSLVADWLDTDDRSFVAAARDLVCSNAKDACGIDTLVGTHKYQVAKIHLDQHNFTKPDYKSYLAYTASDTSTLSGILKDYHIHDGTFHYLTHLFESAGQIAPAGLYAKMYAGSAKDSAHAQHMYGHILPQLGNWAGARDQFLKAHEIHLKEFKTEGIEPKEDWHFPHNFELLMSTLIYLDEIPKATQLLTEVCPIINDTACTQNVTLNLLMGNFAAAETAIATNYKEYATHPVIMAWRLEIALLKRDRQTADRWVTELKTAGELDNGALLWARSAYEILNLSDAEQIDTLLLKLGTQLKQPGFDSWSTGVISSRITAKILEVNGRPELAQKLKALSIGAYEGKTCKTDACRVGGGSGNIRP